MKEKSLFIFLPLILIYIISSCKENESPNPINKNANVLKADFFHRRYFNYDSNYYAPSRVDFYASFDFVNSQLPHFEWKIGDSILANDTLNVDYYFNQPGTYPVTLKVIYPDTVLEKTKNIYIKSNPIKVKISKIIVEQLNDLSSVPIELYLVIRKSIGANYGENNDTLYNGITNYQTVVQANLPITFDNLDILLDDSPSFNHEILLVKKNGSVSATLSYLGFSELFFNSASEYPYPNTLVLRDLIGSPDADRIKLYMEWQY